MTKPTRRSLLKGIAVTGSGLAFRPPGSARGERTRFAAGTSDRSVRSNGSKRLELSVEEASFLAEHAGMRADLFSGFAKRFEDPDLLKRSNFLPSAPVEEIAEAVGLAEDDEDPENHVEFRSSPTDLDDWTIGQVGFYADLGLIAGDVTPVVGDAIELVEKLQWFADVARKSSLQQVFNQGLRGCESCPPGAKGIDGAAARRAQSANRRLANRAEKTAKAARTHAENPSRANARRVADRLAAEYRAGEETDAIDGWATVDPNAYSVGAAGLETPTAVKRLGAANATAVDRVRKVIRFQRGVLANPDQRLVLPASVTAHNENVEEFREETPNYIVDRFTGESGNLFVVDGSGEGVRTTSVIGFEIGPDARFTDYSTTPVQSDFDAYVKREAASILGSGSLSDRDVRRLAEMDAISIDGNGVIDAVKYGLVDSFISEILKRVATKAAENGRVGR